MANLFLSGRIPPILYKRIEDRVSLTGQSKTQILIAALEKYLDEPPEIEKYAEKNLGERVRRLEELVNKLITSKQASEQSIS